MTWRFQTRKIPGQESRKKMLSSRSQEDMGRDDPEAARSRCCLNEMLINGFINL